MFLMVFVDIHAIDSESDLYMDHVAINPSVETEWDIAIDPFEQTRLPGAMEESTSGEDSDYSDAGALCSVPQSNGMSSDDDDLTELEEMSEDKSGMSYLE
jgi:hypothetical protein